MDAQFRRRQAITGAVTGAVTGGAELLVGCVVPEPEGGVQDVFLTSNSSTAVLVCFFVFLFFGFSTSGCTSVLQGEIHQVVEMPLDRELPSI